ncbi:hypothetical protein SEUCBS140593_005216 [Sporothrix eucalyptigena]|uniref:Transcription factor hoxa13 n=1 Tax=Sporothrix eucalyptigena TaxID=1812306 RepID=A0ABP0BVD9_9PEZI
MADTNGASKTGAKAGTANTKKPIVVRKQEASRGFVGYILSTVARIFTWYSIYVLLFRCPSTLEACDASSPRICKPYFQIKQAVAPHALRHYETYAAPYVEVAKPYYDIVDRTVLSPTWKYAVKYGAPQVQQAQAFGQAQWASNIQPQLTKAQDAAVKQYNQVLGPHVDKVTTAVAPYYEIGRNSALQTHHELILPAYEFLSPYALRGYSAAAAFTTGTVVPAAVWTYGQASDFVDSTVLPKLRVLYVDTVEPQLEKIGLNLGRYSDKTQSSSQRTVHNTAPSSFAKPSQPSTSTTSIKPTTSSVAPASSEVPETTTIATAEAASSVASAAPVAPGITEAPKLKRPEPIVQDQADPKEDEVRRNARETVAEDLHAWQEKYTKAADEGAAEIEKSVEEISKRMIRRNVRTTGKALVDDLQKSVVSSLVQLRRDVLNIVGAVVQKSATAEEANEQILVVVRRAGVDIKEKAQAVRSWREEYARELQDTVSRAAENHFQILGSIRDLALQRIGMKWAWMEGVTYKDWAKYHQLKSRFEEWENDLEQLIVTHPGLEAATNAAQAVEDEAMGLAQSAAKELARLKQVAELKIAELDDSEEFDLDTIKANVAAAKAAAIAAAEAEARAAKEAEEAAAAAAEVEAQATLKAQEEAEATEATEETEAEAEAAPIKVTEDETIEAVLADEAAEAEIDTAAVDADKEAADAATVAPDEVPIVLGEAAGTIVEDVPAAELTETEATEAPESTETVHLPVDEVVDAEEVPLAVASSLDAEATIVEEAEKVEAAEAAEETQGAEVKAEETTEGER